MGNYHGIDTETPMGNLRVIATELEYREVSTFLEIVDFLTQKKYRGSIMFSYNLSFDSEAILKTTGDMEFLKDIYMNGVKGVWYTDKIKIRWIPRKLLQICVGSKKTNRTRYCVKILDIAQFYGGWRLDRVAHKYLGGFKDPIDGHRLGSEEGYYEDRKEEVGLYCQKDSELALKAAMLMKETIENTPMKEGKLSFKNPISQAKIAEKYIKSTVDYPSVPVALELFHYYAYKSYHGGIFSTLKRGFFKQKLYSYDINSAYPLQLKDLPHWGNGVFKHVLTPDSENKYGWFECEFDCEWIPYSDYTRGFEIELKIRKLETAITINPKRKVYPTGIRTQWITKIEYEWLQKHHFPVRFIGGFEWFKETDTYKKPFRWIEDVYKRRKAISKEDKEDIKQYALKILLNSSYGKTAQAKRGMGSLTNFFYASYITAGCRLQIAKECVDNPDVIEIATDSILTTVPLTTLPISEKLGEWSLNVYEKGLIVGSGIRQLWKEDGTFKTNARGLTDKTDWNMYEMMLKEKESSWFYHTKNRPLHLGEIIFHHKILSLKDLIVFEDVSKKLNVCTDRKRNWERDYTSFGDLLCSVPMGSKPLRMEDVNDKENTT
jgi:hypothetical protein